MIKLATKLMHICNWVSWKRFTELIIAFLLVRLLFAFYFPGFCNIKSVALFLLFYLIGISSGFGLIFSVDRRQDSYKLKLARIFKRLKEVK